jgi:hypothetical protein
MGSSSARRVRVERGIYRQPNGKYAVCWRHAGRLRFRAVGFDLAEAACAAGPDRGHARGQRARLAAASLLDRRRLVGDRFEAKVAAGERHPRTLEAHRYQLDRELLDLGERARDAPGRDALRAPVRLDPPRPRRAARA